jgi:hypothetical protein
VNGLVRVVLQGEAPTRFLKVFPNAVVEISASGGMRGPARPKFMIATRGENGTYTLTYFPYSGRLELHTATWGEGSRENTFVLNDENVRLIDYIKLLGQVKVTDKLKLQIKYLCQKDLYKSNDESFQKKLESLLMLHKL